MNKFSLKSIFIENPVKISFTLLLVLIELVSSLFIPLFMGFAINDLMNDKYDGLILLCLLIFIAVMVASLRRFYDSRIYGKIYIKVAKEMVKSERNKQSSTSVISARISLLSEMVRFFENGFPSLFGGLINIIGALIIIASIDLSVTLLCLFVVMVIVCVYGLTSARNLHLNKCYNDTLERLVEKVESRDNTFVGQLTKLNIKLSDLETVNYTIVTCVSMGVFVLSMLMTVGKSISYGMIFSLLMYVFEFIESIMILPLFYQKYIRLKEISERLSS